MRVGGLFFLCFYAVLVGAVLARNLDDEEKFMYGNGGNWFGRPIFGRRGWFPGFDGPGGWFPGAGMFPGILPPLAGGVFPGAGMFPGILPPLAGGVFPGGSLAPPPPGRFDLGRWFHDRSHDGQGGGGSFPGARH